MPLRYQWKDLDPTADGNSPNENTRLLIESAMRQDLPLKKMRGREKQFEGKSAAANSRQRKMDRLMYVEWLDWVRSTEIHSRWPTWAALAPSHVPHNERPFF